MTRFLYQIFMIICYDAGTLQEHPQKCTTSTERKMTMMGGGMMNGFGGYGLPGGLIGLIFNLAIIVGFVILVVWAVKRFTSGSASWNQSPGGQSPREILQARYARGELTRDQYQQMLQDLS
jgi:putative membrane protein